MTLGELVRRFSIYCPDEKLVSEMNDFVKFRNNVVHLLATKSISDLNKQSKNMLLQSQMIGNDIMDHIASILKKQNRSLKEN